jgi:hypothetical protein
MRRTESLTIEIRTKLRRKKEEGLKKEKNLMDILFSLIGNDL